MKISNKTLAPPESVKVVILRSPDDIVFTCAAVLDYSDLEKLCPRPKPPLVSNIKEGTSYKDPNDRNYQRAVDSWSDCKLHWMIIQSLRATEGIEWERVKYEDPDTWKLYEKEMKAFLTEAELNKVIAGVFEANSPTSKRRQEALDVFTGKGEEGQVSRTGSLPEGQLSIPSSEHVNV